MPSGSPSPGPRQSEEPLSILGGLGVSCCPRGPGAPWPSGPEVLPGSFHPTDLPQSLPGPPQAWPHVLFTFPVFQPHCPLPALLGALSPLALAFRARCPLPGPGPASGRLPTCLAGWPSAGWAAGLGPGQRKGLMPLRTDRLGQAVAWPPSYRAGGRTGDVWNEGPARFGERVGRQDCSQVWGVTPFYAWQPARHPAHERSPCRGAGLKGRPLPGQQHGPLPSLLAVLGSQASGPPGLPTGAPKTCLTDRPRPGRSPSSQVWADLPCAVLRAATQAGVGLRTLVRPARALGAGAMVLLFPRSVVWPTAPLPSAPLPAALGSGTSPASGPSHTLPPLQGKA